MSPKQRPSRSSPPGRLSWLGWLGIGVAAAAAVLLALRHLGAAELPGCSLDSPCQRALFGRFGSLPWIGWPLAFAGASAFLALLAAWASARDGWPRTLAWIVRMGGLVSVLLLALALQQGTPCPFCIAAQLGNLAFVVASEHRRGPPRARRPELTFVAVFLASTAVLAWARARSEAARDEADERALSESTRAVISGAGAPAFRGRYLQGPERAAIRLVLFTDYQCEDCARIEGEARALAAERSDLSLSIKHFPLCKDCNRRARELGQNKHPNACWAARAAEAAGMIAGGEGFFRMHTWLFERGGSFVDADLHRALASLGFEPGPFLEAMHGTETLARVQADVDEALALGIQGTPMVFLNGVELRGWRAPAALRRAIEELAASGPAPSGPEADRPPGAFTKAMTDWQLEPEVALPARAGGAAPGPTDIVLWSDYLDPTTRELDRRLRALLAGHASVTYSFRHYPLDPECLPSAPSLHPGACLAARAVEAARRLAGAEAAARLHAWLMEARTPFDEAQLRAGAGAVGLEAEALLAETRTDAVRALVSADIQAARRLGIHSIPFLFVAGKKVPRWRVEGGDLLELILASALGTPR